MTPSPAPSSECAPCHAHRPITHLAVLADAWLQRKGRMMWRRVYPGRPDQVGQVRSWVRAQCADTDDAEDAALIAVELVSNALLHTRSGEPGGWFGVEVSRGHDLCIAVHDLGGRSVPAFDTADGQGVLAEHGHGLRVVAELATQVGVEGDPVGGHTVWARLAADGASVPPAS